MQVNRRIGAASIRQAQNISAAQAEAGVDLTVFANVILTVAVDQCVCARLEHDRRQTETEAVFDCVRQAVFTQVNRVSGTVIKLHDIGKTAFFI